MWSGSKIKSASKAHLSNFEWTAMSKCKRAAHPSSSRTAKPHLDLDLNSRPSARLARLSNSDGESRVECQQLGDLRVQHIMHARAWVVRATACAHVFDLLEHSVLASGCTAAPARSQECADSLTDVFSGRNGVSTEKNVVRGAGKLQASVG